ncbi:MAG: TonB-dependent receptor [Prevotella sp.]|nr:TonB-dependent receptor [Prevotella sp.]
MKKISGIIILFGISVMSVAQTDTLTGKTHQLREVTISKDRHERALQSTAPMHVLDRRDMLTMGVTDMADALHRLPGITLRDYGGAGGMKTVSVRGFGAKHTGVAYDGVMLSECQSGETDLSRYSLDNVDHLSLVVGDNDDIFLSARQASTPAVLYIETLRIPAEDLQPHLTTQLKVGSFGYVSPFVRYEQCLCPTFSFSAVGEYVYAENDYPYTIQNGVETIHDRRNNSRMNSGHAELNFLWNTGRTSQLGGKVYYYDNDRQLPGLVRYYTNLSGETLRDRNVFGLLTYRNHWKDKLSLKLIGKYNFSESVYKDELMAGAVNDASYWQREAYASMALLFTPHEHWAFNYSTDYSFNNLNGSSWRTVVGRPYRHTLLNAMTAKYHSHRLTVLMRLLHSLYLNDTKSEDEESDRKDIQRNSANNMRRLSPSVSLSYRMLRDKNLFLRASYKNIFRSPTFNESYYYHYGSTNLQPEITDQLNVGITYSDEFRKALQLSLTLDGYYNHVKDMIVAVPYNMFVWTCVNVDKVTSYGLDVTARVNYQPHPKHQLSVAGNYSYQRVENRNNPDSPTYGYQIAYTPKHIASAAFSYENPWVNASFYGAGMSSRWPNNDHYEGTMIDGYIDFGLTFWRTFTFKNHRLECRVDIKNIFDKQYEIVGHYPMPRRSYQFLINYKF